MDQARQKLAIATSLDPEEAEPEKSQEAMEKIHEARKILAQVRKEHLKEIRQIDLDDVVAFFNEHIRQYARPSEASAFDNLAKTAQRSINDNAKGFEYFLEEMKGKNFEILWRQDWFVVERFKWMGSSPHLFTDTSRFEELVESGTQLMRSDDIDKLRIVVAELSMIRRGDAPDYEMINAVNISKG